jgi:glycosyltransferase involved in cell wall biosynthesis
MIKKRVLILGDAASIHIERWAIDLSKVGYSIAIFSLRKPKKNTLYEEANIQLYVCDKSSKNKNHLFTFLNKVNYLCALPELKKAIKLFKPDIIHAHYASSYGLLGALSQFNPFIISVWGSDVLSFPKINFITSNIIRFNFSLADKILVTSQTLYNASKHYTKKPLTIIAFGIDSELFNPINHVENEAIIFGSAKALTSIYGHDTALKAFALARNELPINSHFLLAGAGNQKENLENLVKNLGITKNVSFIGHLNSDEILSFLNKIDILVNLSRSESFGVIVLEAASCEIPSIVTDTGGLKEIVNQNVTGIRVPLNDEKEAAKAMVLLAKNKHLRVNMGKEARKLVLEKYKWAKCLNEMSDVYLSVLNN